MFIQFSAFRRKLSLLVLPSKKGSPIIFPEVLVLCFQIGSRSSVYSPESSVRKTGSYIYEEFMPTDGTDVKVRQSLEWLLPACLGWLEADSRTVPAGSVCWHMGTAHLLQTVLQSHAAAAFPLVYLSLSWCFSCSVWPSCCDAEWCIQLESHENPHTALLPLGSGGGRCCMVSSHPRLWQGGTYVLSLGSY